MLSGSNLALFVFDSAKDQLNWTKNCQTDKNYHKLNNNEGGAIIAWEPIKIISFPSISIFLINWFMANAVSLPFTSTVELYPKGKAASAPNK